MRKSSQAHLAVSRLGFLPRVAAAVLKSWRPVAQMRGIPGRAVDPPRSPLPRDVLCSGGYHFSDIQILMFSCFQGEE